MGQRRFYSNHELANNKVLVDGEEFHHIKNVLRARCGDELEIINGRGRWLRGRIRSMQNQSLWIAVEQQQEFPCSKLHVIIAPSLTKSHAMNWLIEKLCEMGIDEIRPLECERTDVSFSQSSLQRWEKIAIQALKVNRRFWLTRILPPVTPALLIANSQEIPGKILLDIHAKKNAAANASFPALAVIGPPGDFTDAEKELFRANHFSPRLINDAILKTETAALSIAAILKND